MSTRQVSFVPCRLLVVLFVALLAMLTSKPVRAEGLQEARTTFERGVEASRAQQWDEARKQFRRSLELVPKPSTMFNLALADIKLGLGSEALEQLDAFEKAASPTEHAAMLERARVMRPQAKALIESEAAQAENRGKELTHAKDGLSDEARKDVVLGQDNYARGRDREALAAFERAYRVSRRPELLYNIGVVADRMREDTRALSAFERFVGALPDAPEAAVAQVRSEALRSALEERERARSNQRMSEPSSVPTTSASPESHTPPPAPALGLPRALIVIGALSVAGSIGAMFGVLDRAKKIDECDTGMKQDGQDMPCENRGLLSNQKSIWTGVTVGTAVLGAGLITAGAVLLVRRKETRQQASVLLPWFAGRAGGVSFQHAF